MQMDTRSKMMAVYNNKSLTEDQKKKQMMDMSVPNTACPDGRHLHTGTAHLRLKAMQQQMMQAAHEANADGGQHAGLQTPAPVIVRKSFCKEASGMKGQLS